MFANIAEAEEAMKTLRERYKFLLDDNSPMREPVKVPGDAESHTGDPREHLKDVEEFFQTCKEKPSPVNLEVLHILIENTHEAAMAHGMEWNGVEGP